MNHSPGHETAVDVSRLTEWERRQEAYRVALAMFRHTPEWTTFFREILGVGGELRKLFRTPEEMEAFEQSPEYRRILRMVTQLRARTDDDNGDGKESIRMITVRMPRSLHEALRAEAHHRQTSLNRLCITKLLQAIDDPSEQEPF